VTQGILELAAGMAAVGEDVPLTALDLLAGLVARGPPLSVVVTP